VNFSRSKASQLSKRLILQRFDRRDCLSLPEHTFFRKESFAFVDIQVDPAVLDKESMLFGDADQLTPKTLMCSDFTCFHRKLKGIQRVLQVKHRRVNQEEKPG
jgi:hypothetical protein